ncbi:MAG: EamA family transporter [Thermoprotei archaeon]
MDSYVLGVAYAVFSVFTTAGNRVLLSGPLTRVDSRFASLVASIIGLAILFVADVSTEGITRTVSAPGWVLGLFVVVGVLNSGISRLLLYLSIRHLGANQAETLQSTTALFAFVFAAALLHEGASLHALFGGILIVVGSLLVESRVSSYTRGGNPGLGVTSALLSSLVFAFVLILIKAGLTSGYPYMSAVFISSVGAFAFNALLYHPKKLRSEFTMTPKKIVLSVVCASILITLSQIFRFAAFSYASAVVVSTVISTSPALVVALNKLISNRLEILSPKTILSVLLVILGGILVSY